MKKRSGLLATATLAVGLALSHAPAVAGASTAFSRGDGTAPGWQGGGWHAAGSYPATDLSLVHGIPGLDVDIYVVKNFFSYKELPDVHFGTAADLTTAFPGWVTPGLYTVDVVPTGTSPFKPLLLTSFFLGSGQSKTVAAYVTATPSGAAGQPTLGVFTNDVSSTGGQSRCHRPSSRRRSDRRRLRGRLRRHHAVLLQRPDGHGGGARGHLRRDGDRGRRPRDGARQRREHPAGRQHQHAGLRHRRLPVDLHRGPAGGPHRLSDPAVS